MNEFEEPVCLVAVTETNTTANPTFSPMVTGTLFGMVGAVCYSITNIILRSFSIPGDLAWSAWLTALKASVPALLAAIVLLHGISRGKAMFPTPRMITRILMTSLVMQFGGNLMFQYSLGLGGLVLTVPITFACIILTGAILGRLILAEGITVRSACAMGLLISAITCLSIAGEIPKDLQQLSTSALWGTVLSSCVAGVSYGLCGVVIRQSVSGSSSLSGTLVLFSSAGVIIFGSISLYHFGWQLLWEKTSPIFPTMVLGSISNAIAFFCVAAAFKRISVVRTNLLNSSQIAMCSLGGIFLFDEPLTLGVFIGITLTITGLLLMDHHS